MVNNRNGNILCSVKWYHDFGAESSSTKSPKILQFNPEKIEQVEAEFNGKKSQRYRYTVIDPNNSNQEKYLEVGKRTSEDIDAYLSEGKTVLKIQRFGLGKDIRYHVTPA